MKKTWPLYWKFIERPSISTYSDMYVSSCDDTEKSRNLFLANVFGKGSHYLITADNSPLQATLKYVQLDINSNLNIYFTTLDCVIDKTMIDGEWVDDLIKTGKARKQLDLTSHYAENLFWVMFNSLIYMSILDLDDLKFFKIYWSGKELNEICDKIFCDSKKLIWEPKFEELVK